MNIQHITYDESHRRRSISSRASDASTKIKNYISRRMSRQADVDIWSQNPSSVTEIPVTMWPQVGAHFPLPNKHGEMTAYLTKEHHQEKTAQKEDKATVSKKNSSNYLPLADINDTSEEYVLPRLRRMPKFSDIVKAKVSIKSRDPQQQTSDGNDTIERLQKLRKAMKDGILEQVVPPRERLALPLHRFDDQSPKAPGESSQIRSLSQHDNPSHQRNSSRSRKTRSTSSKFADYIRTSADILDEKRRDVQSKFQAPFEHLNYPSFSLSRRVSVSSSKSAESFWCVGEGVEEQKSNTQAILEFKARKPESGVRDIRLSGVGMTPWTNHVPDNCKNCGQFAMVGPQGLCEECEYRHKSPDLEHTNLDPDCEVEEEIRPTPPLKDRKTLSTKRKQDPQRVFQVCIDSSEYETRPAVPPKDIGSRPIFNPVPSRRLSQNIRLQDCDNDEEWYLNWKTSSQQDEFEKTQNTFDHWSLNSETNDQGRGTENDKARLIDRNGKMEEKGKGKGRRTA